MFDVTRFKDELQCKGCYNVIWKSAERYMYINGYCNLCRDKIPRHIPEAQHVRFLEVKTRKKYG